MSLSVVRANRDDAATSHGACLWPPPGTNPTHCPPKPAARLAEPEPREKTLRVFNSSVGVKS